MDGTILSLSITLGLEATGLIFSCGMFYGKTKDQGKIIEELKSTLAIETKTRVDEDKELEKGMSELRELLYSQLATITTLLAKQGTDTEVIKNSLLRIPCGDHENKISTLSTSVARIEGKMEAVAEGNNGGSK